MSELKATLATNGDYIVERDGKFIGCFYLHNRACFVWEPSSADICYYEQGLLKAIVKELEKLNAGWEGCDEC